LATLRLADAAVYATLDERGRTIGGLASAALAAAGVEHQLQYAGNLFSVFFAGAPVVDFAGAQAAETFRYKAFFHAMLDAGVYLPPSAFEAWFVNVAIDDDALGIIADALPSAAQAAAAATS
jgi:glutamate-1-semialdehyde 2,1-aminomutase